MASTDNRNSVQNRRQSVVCADTTIEYTEEVMALKVEKTRAKSNFTRVRNKLASQLEQDLPSRRTIREICSSLDTWMEFAMKILENLSDLYIRYNELKKGSKVVTGNGEARKRIFCSK